MYQSLSHANCQIYASAGRWHSFLFYFVPVILRMRSRVVLIHTRRNVMGSVNCYVLFTVLPVPIWRARCAQSGVPVQCQGDAHCGLHTSHDDEQETTRAMNTEDKQVRSLDNNAEAAVQSCSRANRMSHLKRSNHTWSRHGAPFVTSEHILHMKVFS